MRNIICTLLFNLIIFINSHELWAADNEANWPANLPEHQMPPPGPNRFAKYPDGHVLYENGDIVGTVRHGRFLTLPELCTQTLEEERMEPKDFLPDGAQVWRQPKGLVGFLFDKRINGPDEKGEVRVLAAQNGDSVICKGRILAKYNEGWKEFKLNEKPNASPRSTVL